MPKRAFSVKPRVFYLYTYVYVYAYVYTSILKTLSNDAPKHPDA